jgi:hypothetical protein
MLYDINRVCSAKWSMSAGASCLETVERMLLREVYPSLFVNRQQFNACVNHYKAPRLLSNENTRQGNADC